METFSLLFKSLDQTITRESLEEASDAATSVARADCPRLLRENSGILVSRLPGDEAHAFQASLAGRGFETEVVSDALLPVLHETYQIQRVETRDEVLVLTDSLGRERVRPLTDLVFLAAGFLNRIEFKTELHQRLDFRGHEGRGAGMPKLVTERELKEETEQIFRMDFFFWAEPNRFHLLLTNETSIFHQGAPIRMKLRVAIERMMSDLAKLLPPERLNRPMRDPLQPRVYPSLASYENEIRWHFQRLKS